MDILLVPILLLIKAMIGIAVMIIVADVVIGWLLTANVFNTNNQIVYSIIDTISRLSDSILNPIRRKMPSTIGMLDVSPIILILLLTFLENVVNRILIRIP
jgi:YggT family protein